LTGEPEGFEVKGLATPGRVVNYDSNSSVPTGNHNGREIYYVFARYPETKETKFAVHDLVICHGDFMNPGSDYVHKNKSFKTFGAYGDILVRDRKMYVVRTPHDIATGLEKQRTLIIPASESAPEGLIEVGRITRQECEKIPVIYQFDFRTNELTTIEEPNPTAGQLHEFVAYRVPGEEKPPVSLRRA
jgi:hypothetical protein